MRVALVLVVVACAHAAEPLPPAVEKPVLVASLSDAGARATTERFVSAAEQRDFATAYSMLSGALRERYTPERLGRDFDGEPLAKERLQRIRAALSGPFTMSPEKAVLPLGTEKALTLVHVGEIWQVAALE